MLKITSIVLSPVEATTQAYRPYVVGDGATLQAAQTELINNRWGSPTYFRPWIDVSGASSGEVPIDYGWGAKRYMIRMTIQSYHNNAPAATFTVNGFTIDPTGNLDPVIGSRSGYSGLPPEAPVIIDTVTNYQLSPYMPPLMGTPTTILRTTQQLLNANDHVINTAATPSTVLESGILNAPGSSNVIIATSKVTAKHQVAVDTRDSLNPSRMSSTITGAIKSGQSIHDFSNSGSMHGSPFTDALSLLPSPLIDDNHIFDWLKGYTEGDHGRQLILKWGEIEFLCGQDTEITINRADFSMGFNDKFYEGNWGSSDLTTHLAYKLLQAGNAAMIQSGMLALRISLATDPTNPSVPSYKLDDTPLCHALSDPQSALASWIGHITASCWRYIIQPVPGRYRQIWATMTITSQTSSTIAISVDGGPVYQYMLPNFATGLIAPSLTNTINLTDIASAMSVIFNH